MTGQQESASLTAEIISSNTNQTWSNLNPVAGAHSGSHEDSGRYAPPIIQSDFLRGMIRLTKNTTQAMGDPAPGSQSNGLSFTRRRCYRPSRTEQSVESSSTRRFWIKSRMRILSDGGRQPATRPSHARECVEEGGLLFVSITITSFRLAVLENRALPYFRTIGLVSGQALHFCRIHQRISAICSDSNTPPSLVVVDTGKGSCTNDLPSPLFPR
ncbi:hypothetical protein BJ322DRAFT_1038340 [Thelephora terrestris]|uniref:Uncharacterized protein n=1 Tax=Thelephora terrestris TaxID=56493 RepID=A0A9P6HNE6_9AGAM|nr:hypothetical protein BJ322DRAFT_1038340 [Thelephora terrestris]